MSRFFAFLRGINVGGHTVKMDRLRAIFEQLDFTNVDTFIASGNVIFDTKKKNPASLETAIEKALEQSLGFASATFLRTPAELGAILRHEAFTPESVAAAHAIHVIFLRAEPDAKVREQMLAECTDVDEFHVHGRELYWLCRVKLTDSPAAKGLMASRNAVESTARNINTLRKLAAKYGV